MTKFRFMLLSIFSKLSSTKLKKTMLRSKNDFILIFIAALIAIITPLFIMPIIYPAFQVFLPEGNIVLTSSLRITATLIMSMIDYGLAYIAIYHTLKRKKLLFNFICYFLTLIWNIIMGMMWYLSL